MVGLTCRVLKAKSFRFQSIDSDGFVRIMGKGKKRATAKAKADSLRE
jgi:hypothetical protein